MKVVPADYISFTKCHKGWTEGILFSKKAVVRY
jgi:hypothetical protein